MVFVGLGAILGLIIGAYSFVSGASLLMAATAYVLTGSFTAILLPIVLSAALPSWRKAAPQNTTPNTAARHGFQPVDSLVDRMFDRSQSAYHEVAAELQKPHKTGIILSKSREDARKYQEWAWEDGTDLVAAHDPLDALSYIDDNPGYFQIVVLDAVNIEESVACLMCDALWMRRADIQVIFIQEFPRALSVEGARHPLLRMIPILTGAGKTAFRMALLKCENPQETWAQPAPPPAAQVRRLKVVYDT